MSCIIESPSKNAGVKHFFDGDTIMQVKVTDYCDDFKHYPDPFQTLVTSKFQEFCFEKKFAGEWYNYIANAWGGGEITISKIRKMCTLRGTNGKHILFRYINLDLNHFPIWQFQKKIKIYPVCKDRPKYFVGNDLDNVYNRHNNR